MPRPLPSEAEARAILSRHRTRPRHRPPPKAANTLAPVIRALDARFGQGAGGLENRWPEIVGEQLARVTEPIRLTRGRSGHGGTLELRVVGPAAAFVQHQSVQILERVNLFLGEGSAEKLRISQGPIKVRLPRGQPARKRVERPLDAAQDEALGRSVDTAADPKLKTALMRLGRAALKPGG